MGPCRYCKEIIYLDWIAERGYHRSCHEKYLNNTKDMKEFQDKLKNQILKREKKAGKRRIRRAEIRNIKKGKV